MVPAVRTFFFFFPSLFSPPCREDWGEWEEEDDTEETADSLGGAIVRQAREATPGTDSTDTTPVPSLGTRRPAAAKVRTDSVEPPPKQQQRNVSTPVSSVGPHRPAGAKVRTDGIDNITTTTKTSPPPFHLSDHGNLQLAW